MVDWFGRWHEEKNYSTYSDELWTYYDCMEYVMASGGIEMFDYEP